MTRPDRDPDVERAGGPMNRIAKGGRVAAVVIVAVALLALGWQIGLLR